MARSRNLKPGFFTNDTLGECDPLARILFAGLWCIADREGRLEDRPKRIRAEILPYDQCDADVLLDQLADRDFVIRYESGGNRYIQVANFDKHQNPHVKEQASNIPAPDKSGACPVQSNDMPDESTEVAGLIPSSLIPDSLNLIPDSLKEHGAQVAPNDALPAADEPQRKTSGTPKRANQLPEDFEPDETAHGLAAELGVSLSAELPKFRDYHAAKGKPMKDWQAALRTWLRNAKAFERPAPKQSEADRRADWLADITGRKANAIDAPAKLVG